MHRRGVALLALSLVIGCSGSDGTATGGSSGGSGAGGSGGSGTASTEVSLTWLGVTHWLVQFEDKTILLDAYFSRPMPGISEPTEEGLDLMQRVLDAAGVESIDLILVGHSHFDHAVDCGAVALRTGAQVVGTETTCLVAEAEGLPRERCTVVGTDDGVDIDGVSIRTIRTIHSNPRGIGLFATLDEVPSNVFDVPVGGVVSFLVTFDGDPPLSMLYQNSIGPLDGDDSSLEDYAANLALVLGGRQETTLWLSPIGFLSSVAELEPYIARVQPRFVLAHHWDGLTPDIESGVITSFTPNDAVAQAIDAEGAVLLTPQQYFDRFVMTSEGVVRSDEAPIQAAFGL